MKKLDVPKLVVSLENYITNDIEMNLGNDDNRFVFNFEDGTPAVEVVKRVFYDVVFDGEWYNDFSTSVERQLLGNIKYTVKNKILRKPLEVHYYNNIDNKLRFVNFEATMIFNDCLFNKMEKIEVSEYLLYSNSHFNRCEFYYEG